MAIKENIKKSNVVLGRNIERLRLLKEMSRMQVGRKVNQKEQQIVRYERGGALVPLPVLERIAEALGEPIAKKIIRRISSVRKLEVEKNTKMDDELIDLYNEAVPDYKDDYKDNT